MQGDKKDKSPANAAPRKVISSMQVAFILCHSHIHIKYFEINR